MFKLYVLSLELVEDLGSFNVLEQDLCLQIPGVWSLLEPVDILTRQGTLKRVTGTLRVRQHTEKFLEPNS